MHTYRTTEADSGILQRDVDYYNHHFEALHLVPKFTKGRCHHPYLEVDPDMHNTFSIFGNEDCILGSFNIAFDTWEANWESGMTLHSAGVCRLLDNIFQSIRGAMLKQGLCPEIMHERLERAHAWRKSP